MLFSTFGELVLCLSFVLDNLDFYYEPFIPLKNIIFLNFFCRLCLISSLDYWKILELIVRYITNFPILEILEDFEISRKNIIISFDLYDKYE